MIVCLCRAVSDRQIRSAVNQGARSMGEVRSALGCGGCCGKCVPRVRELIDEHSVGNDVHSVAGACACAA